MHSHLVEAEQHLRIIIKDLQNQLAAKDRHIHRLERKIEQLTRPQVKDNVVKMGGV